MNSETIMRLANKKHPVKKWWNKNRLFIMRCLLFYIYLPWRIYTDCQKRKEKKRQEVPLIFDDKKKCKKYLDKVMPKMILRYADSLEYILINTSSEYSNFNFSDFYQSLYIKEKYKKFFTSIPMGDFIKYIREEYEIEGYEKIILDTYGDWEVVTKIEWCTNFEADYDKGVLFCLGDRAKELREKG